MMNMFYQQSNNAPKREKNKVLAKAPTENSLHLSSSNLSGRKTSATLRNHQKPEGSAKVFFGVRSSQNYGLNSRSSLQGG
jgi:hypothetical protein